MIYLLLKASDVLASFLSAVINGVFYGLIVWLVFIISFRWVERSISKKKFVEKK
ncbi:MAG: hypothetical protein ACLFU9_01985 [Candidatus Bathyarchaeia archaeon]